MTREEHKKAVERLLGMVSAEHQADASELLTTLSEDYETTLTTSETVTNENTNLKANVEKLRKVNTDLFLKVGTPTKEVEKTDEPEIPELSFDKLFNEKGELI